jgi:hypothetical protein
MQLQCIAWHETCCESRDKTRARCHVIRYTFVITTDAY